MATGYGSFGAIPDVGNIDINKLGQRTGGGSRGPDYIPYNAKGRDPFARTSFNTGIYWLGGFVGGGSYGFVQGWRGATSSNYKIRFNSVMNGVSKQGSKWGNTLGLVAFLHTFSGALLEYGEAERYLNSKLTVPALSGMITGAVFFSSASPRAIALASAAGGVISVGYSAAGEIFNELTGRGGRF